MSESHVLSTLDSTILIMFEFKSWHKQPKALASFRTRPRNNDNVSAKMVAGPLECATCLPK